MGLSQADAARFAGSRPTVPVSDDDAFPAEGDAPGWILIGPSAEPESVVGLLERLGRRPGSWSPLLVREGAEGLAAVPLSPGFETGEREARDRIEAEGSPAGLLSFRHALKDLARLRHDLNNPLTAALAEVQLLLLDQVAGSDEEAALTVVEDQIRRLGELVAELAPYRVPGR
jgi:signal transduction histidine kinase